MAAASPGESAGADDPLGRLMRRTGELGRYRVSGEIARGGMGAIYKVWDQDLRRELAMKVVLTDSPETSSGTDEETHARLARFVEEAQVTGQLEHPGIVPVHELGRDADGRAYFTMKLVNGITLAEVFTRHREGSEEWNTTRVLGVLLRACEALAYAHAKGVIHRDLKPPNVMVGAFGEVHVMDWGLARILGRSDVADASARIGSSSSASVQGVRSEQRGRVDASSMHTLDGDVLGTPAYMAPEQAAGRLAELGPQADVYALGAMLYELLTGNPPYVPPGSSTTQVEVWQAVRRGPPVALATAAPAAPLELVAICEKAMARDWRERYADMSSLAADLRAFLERRVVSAYRTGTWAETVKWIQRNRALAASLAAVVVALVAGLTAAIVLKRNSDENAERAQANALETRIVADFQSRMIADVPVDELGRAMIESLRQEIVDGLERSSTSTEGVASTLASLDAALEASNPTNAARRVLGEQIFGRTLAKLETEYADRPKLGAQLRLPLARSMWDLGLFELGERTSRQALETLRTEAGDRDFDTLSALNLLGLHLRALGRAEEAESASREALVGYREQLGPEHPNTVSCMSNLGLLLTQLGRSDEAETLLREALAAGRAAGMDVFHSLVNLSGIVEKRGDLDEAQRCLREALELRRGPGEAERPETLTAANNLALLLLRMGRHAEAEELCVSTVAAQRRVLGDAHPSTLTSIHNLGLVFNAQRRFPEAETQFRASVAGWRALKRDQDPCLLTSMRYLGVLLVNSGRAEESVPYLRDAWNGLRATLGEDQRITLQVASNLEDALRAARRLEETESLARQCLPLRRKALGDRDPDTLESIRAHASTLRLLGRFDEAEPLYREALEGFRAVRGGDHALTLRTHVGLSHVLRARGAFAECETLLRPVLEKGPTVPELPAGVVTEARQLLRDVYLAWHEREPGAGHDARALELERAATK